MILVTGGTGLLGAHLIYQLISNGESVRALKRTSSDTGKTRKIFSYYSDDFDELFSKIEWIEGDVLDFASLLKAMEGIDLVYHTAATVSFQSNDKASLVQTNVQGTENIVNASLQMKIKKLLHVSSIGALGRAGSSGVVTEDSEWNNKKTSVYSNSKYQAEIEVWRGIAEGLDAVIVNPSIILGPGDWTTGSAKLFTTMYDGLKFYSVGSNGFIDVKDVVKSMVLLMKSDISGERFILSSENIFYKQLFEWMAIALKVPIPKHKAGKLLSEIVWRGLWLKGILTGKKSTITKETAETANQEYKYSNEKVRKATGINFIKVKDCIDTNAKFFLDDKN